MAAAKNQKVFVSMFVINPKQEFFIKGSVAERSKAADSSSVIVRCACSNHAGVNIF